jgi:hypothetical protein
VKQLREQAMAELAASSLGKNTMKSTTFLTEGDVLCAYLTRLALAGSQTQDAIRPRSRTVLIVNAYDMRRALAQEPVLLPRDGAYVSNAVASVLAFSTVRDILSQPLGQTAKVVRESVAKLGTRPQIEAVMALNMDDLRAGGPGLQKVAGTPGMRMVAFSNWTRGRFFEVDFGAAVVGGRKEENGVEMEMKMGKEVRKVVPSYVASQLSSRFFPLRDIFIVVGKDAEGNYWSRARLARRDVKKMEEILTETEMV